ncbi:hypothetical protein [Acinetobacter modestus]|uniref:Uncharacterized protein n=1 Tax=Acinetobacter modestus TaxID=1776740 RepID=A0ABP2TTL0_9GAMM|nr:hypothetical protein [Acinetobacter modestus]ENU25640.1 hypothetical protein F992_03384 [Acinetobacter modestus]
MKTILSKPNTLANQVKALYSKPAQQQAVGLVLADYQFSKRTVCYKGFFLCVLSLCVRILWRSWRGTRLRVQVTLRACLPTLFSFATNYLAVNGKALLISKERINHA